jgi:hypothetical protein
MKKWTSIVLEQELNKEDVNSKLAELKGKAFDKYPIGKVEDIIKSFDEKLYINKKGMDDAEVEDGGDGDSDMDYPVMKSIEDGDDEEVGKVNIKIDHKDGKYNVKNVSM